MALSAWFTSRGRCDLAFASVLALPSYFEDYNGLLVQWLIRRSER